MPYDLKNPPDKLQGLGSSKQRQWIHVFNSCMKIHNDDIKCHKMAWGVTGGWDHHEAKGGVRDEMVELKAVADMAITDAMDMCLKNQEDEISRVVGSDVELKERESEYV
jgi:hypothetical protein